MGLSVFGGKEQRGGSSNSGGSCGSSTVAAAEDVARPEEQAKVAEDVMTTAVAEVHNISKPICGKVSQPTTLFNGKIGENDRSHVKLYTQPASSQIQTFDEMGVAARRQAAAADLQLLPLP